MKGVRKALSSWKLCEVVVFFHENALLCLNFGPGKSENKFENILWRYTWINVFWQHLQMNKHVCAVLVFEHFTQERRSIGRARGSERGEDNGNLQKTKQNITNYNFFCSSTMLATKIITEIIEKRSEFSGCTNVAIIFFQVDFDETWNFLEDTYKKTPSPPLPLFERARRAMPRFSGVPGFTNILWPMWESIIYDIEDLHWFFISSSSR